MGWFKTKQQKLESKAYKQVLEKRALQARRQAYEKEYIKQSRTKAEQQAKAAVSSPGFFGKVAGAVSQARQSYARNTMAQPMRRTVRRSTTVRRRVSRRPTRRMSRRPVRRRPTYRRVAVSRPTRMPAQKSMSENIMADVWRL